MTTTSIRRTAASAFAACLLTCKAEAQDVLASGGAFFQNTNTTIAFTIGEPVIATHGQASFIATQGFHQPPDDFSTEVFPTADPTIQVYAYPNPAREQVTITMDGQGALIDLQVLDAAGRLTAIHLRKPVPYMLDVSELAAGCYSILAGTQEGHLATIKLAITR